MKVILVVLMGLLLVFGSCASRVASVGVIEGANEDEFFVQIAEWNGEDSDNDYTRTHEADISAGLLAKIKEAARVAEPSYSIGSVYKTTLTEKAGKETIKYVLYLLDTVISTKEVLVTTGGRNVPVELGQRTSKWALYKVTPRVEETGEALDEDEEEDEEDEETGEEGE